MTYFNDEVLVINYQKNKDAKSLEILYKTYIVKVQKYIYSFVKDKETTLDLSQDVFLKVAEKLETLKNPITFQLWLFRIARNMALQYLRNNKVVLEELTTTYVPRFKNDDQEITEANIILLESSLGELSEEERFLITEKYFENKSIVELCNMLKCGESAVKMKIHRTRQKLHNRMINRIAV